MVKGHTYGLNEHVSLESDLKILSDFGYSPINLKDAITLIRADGSEPKKYFCLTFDDGSPYDHYDYLIENNTYFGFTKILGNASFFKSNPSVKATSFVIVSEDARKALFGSTDITKLVL